MLFIIKKLNRNFMNVNKCLMNFYVLFFFKKRIDNKYLRKFYYFSIICFLNFLLEIKLMNIKICMNIGFYVSVYM